MTTDLVSEKQKLKLVMTIPVGSCNIYTASSNLDIPMKGAKDVTMWFYPYNR